MPNNTTPKPTSHDRVSEALPRTVRDREDAILPGGRGKDGDSDRAMVGDEWRDASLHHSRKPKGESIEHDGAHPVRDR